MTNLSEYHITGVFILTLYQGQYVSVRSYHSEVHYLRQGWKVVGTGSLLPLPKLILGGANEQGEGATRIIYMYELPCSRRY